MPTKKRATPGVSKTSTKAPAVSSKTPKARGTAVSPRVKKSTPAAVEKKSGPSHIVGIGASAGGLEALEQFFEHMPIDSGMGFVVVQHLSPDYKSLMVELLSKRTKMPVLRAEEALLVEPNTVYLIPPKRNLTINRGRLHLAEQEMQHGLNLPIDVFFRSLGEDQGEKAIGIVLSGTGSDGMRGVRAIKEMNGLVFAQEERSAKFDGMPRSAISTGLVDFILTPEQMPEALTKYVNHPFVSSGPHPAPVLKTSNDVLARLLGFLQKQGGVDFTHYKPNTIIRRIERRMSLNQIEKLEDYLSFMIGNPPEVATLSREILIGVTKFFRDPEAFDIIQSAVLPALFEQQREDRTIRVWCAGCSTGEEAYSLAILFKEYLEEKQIAYEVKIFATDIDSRAIEFASQGVYPESVAADLPVKRLTRYFNRVGECYQIRRNIREMVIFARQNLIKDPPFTKIDLVTCRNLLIYFQSHLQRKVLTYFSFALNVNGFLFLGGSETLGDLASRFLSIDQKWKIFQSRGRSKPLVLEAPLAPKSAPRRFREFRYEDSRPTVPHVEHPVIESAYQALIKDYVPPSLLVNDRFELLHIFGEAGDLLRIPSGQASLSVLAMVPKQVSVILATAMQKVLKDLQESRYQNIRVTTPTFDRLIDLRVKPIIQTKGTQPFLLILLQESRLPSSNTDAAPAIDMSAHAEERIIDLERELQYNKENLQATIEELETSNEELQATNEELIASNEELQSTNEELQSVNEELYTVNAEYQNKIQELVEVTNDIDNLLQSSNIGTLFLDNSLNIRKFTTTLRRFFNVLEQDVGRPIEHISHHLLHEGLMADIRQVLASQSSLEREIAARDGSWLLLSLVPSFSPERTIQGVILTLIDISRLKSSQGEVCDLNQQQQRMIDHVPTPLVLLDNAGLIKSVNRSWGELLVGIGVQVPDSGLSRGYLELMEHAAGDRFGVLKKELSAILAGKKETARLELSLSLNSAERCFLFIIGSLPIEGKRGAMIQAKEIPADGTSRID